MTGWRTVQLRHVTRCLDGLRIPLNSEQRADIPGEYPYWGANGVVDSVGEYLFDEDLILLGEDGAPFGDRLKDVAFLVEGRVWVNNHIHVLRPLDSVDPRFLVYALNAVDWPVHITGSTREKLTQDDMNRVRVACPARPVQRAIADYLDTETARIDALITKKQRMIELLEQRFAVSSDDVVWDGAPTAPLRHFVSELTVGIVVQPASYYVEPGTVGAVPAVRAVDTKPYSIQANDLVWISAEGNALHRKSQLRSGDVVVVRTGNAGAACVVPTELEGANCISNVIVRCSDRLDPAFIEAVLNSARTREAIAAESVGAIQKHFGVDAAKQLLIPDVAIEEQRRRAAVLTALRTRLERTLAGIDHQINLLRERRQALITAVVTGELEVPGVAA